MRARLVLLTTCFFVAACQSVPLESQPAKLDTGHVDRVVDQSIADDAFPFVYVRLEDKTGRVIYEREAVNRRYLPDAQIDGSTWIRIWSMSKIVTIAIALDLIEQGVFALDDPVTRFLPELANRQVARASDGSSLVDAKPGESACPLTYEPATGEMTVEDLINHKAGFTYTFGGIPCFEDQFRAQDLPLAVDSDALIQKIAALPLIDQPGARYYYGINTTVLGLLAERATGKTLAELVTERVTTPLGIEGLQYGLPVGASLLPTTVRDDGQLRAAKPGELDIYGAHVPDYDPAHPLYFGGAGMLATADGYADFLRMLLAYGTLNGHRFLDQQTVELMVAPHTQLGSPSGHNGYNIWVSSGVNADGSTGPRTWSGGGYESTSYWIDPEREFVGVIMSQMSGAYSKGLARDREIIRAIYDTLPLGGESVDR